MKRKLSLQGVYAPTLLPTQLGASRHPRLETEPRWSIIPRDCINECTLYYLKVEMITAKVVQTSVTVNNSPIHDYAQKNDQASPTYEMTPGFKPFTKLNPLISSCRLQIHLSILACIMWNHTGGSFPVFLNLIISFSKQFYPFKDCLFGLRSCSQNFTAHYSCRNADLNLILVLAMTNGFIFHTINSLWKLVGYAWPCLSVIGTL